MNGSLEEKNMMVAKTVNRLPIVDMGSSFPIKSQPVGSLSMILVRGCQLSIHIKLLTLRNIRKD